MFFDNDIISFQIFDVLYMNQKNTKSINRDRDYDALSFRLKADTIIDFEDKSVPFFDNCIGYFPSQVNYTRTAKKDKMIVVDFKAFNYHSSEIEKFVPENPEKYRSLFEQLYDCWSKKGTAYKYKSSAILNTIFAEIYRDNKKSDSNKSKIASSIRHIERNYLKADFSLDCAIEKSYVSPTYFRRLFKEEFGVPPKQYIIEKRMSYAAELIMTDYYSLQEVASLCGYSDYKHFSAEFKKTHGVSPSKYSKR
ncbi:MAG: helix-turn-helix transcriptional regulator [Clostridia bacterium]|nr:helix-turn-helix transcriptional regulator [Clostridia bacterium]